MFVVPTGVDKVSDVVEVGGVSEPFALGLAQVMQRPQQIKEFFGPSPGLRCVGLDKLVLLTQADYGAFPKGLFLEEPPSVEET